MFWLLGPKFCQEFEYDLHLEVSPRNSVLQDVAFSQSWGYNTPEFRTGLAISTDMYKKHLIPPVHIDKKPKLNSSPKDLRVFVTYIESWNIYLAITRLLRKCCIAWLSATRVLPALLKQCPMSVRTYTHTPQTLECLGRALIRSASMSSRWELKVRLGKAKSHPSLNAIKVNNGGHFAHYNCCTRKCLS